MDRSHRFTWAAFIYVLLSVTFPCLAEVTLSGDIDPTDLAWWANGGDPAGTVYIGENDDGKVVINDGSVLHSRSSYFGYESGAFGEVTLSGNGSTWTNINDFTVGRYGEGVLTINNGGVVTSKYCILGCYTGSIGVATVSGAESRMTIDSSLSIGLSGSGTLNIENGGVVSSLYCTLGDGFDTGSYGYATVNISGTNSAWYNDHHLTVGNRGEGHLVISNGGAAYNENGKIANLYGFSSDVLVTGEGSIWENCGDFFVGCMGNAVLTIEDGGKVSNIKEGYIAYQSGNSSATVRGAGSIWDNGDSLYVGGVGNGVLNIRDEAQVNVEENTFVAYDSIGNGAIALDNGVLNTGGLIAAPGELNGVGVINTTGLVSDIHLIFDQNHGLQQQIIFADGSGQDITINVNQDFTGASRGALGAGCRGDGSLYVGDSQVVRSSDGYIGFHPLSNGVVTITGAGSTWNNSGDLNIGYKGKGSLLIENGGSVVSGNDCIFGEEGEASVIVRGTNSSLNNTYNLEIGIEGSGTLTVEAGGKVTNLSCEMGDRTGSCGMVRVSGVDSIWNNTGDLYIGEFGDGEIIIEDGAKLYHGGYRTLIGDRYSSTSAATVKGIESIWFNSGDLIVGKYGCAMLCIEDGGAVINENDLLINNRSTLNMILTSTNPLLDIGGDAELDGYLQVGMVDGSVLNLHDVFTLIDLTDPAATISGSFINYAEGDSVGTFSGYNLVLSYVGGDGNDVTLTAVPEPGMLSLLVLGVMAVRQIRQKKPGR